MAVNLSPYGGVGAQFFDSNGDPLSGGKLYTYAAGTTTPQTTFTTSAGDINSAHSNPIILDAAGRIPTGEIWLTDGLEYKFVLKTSTDITIATYDNVSGINSVLINYTAQQEIQTATAGQTVFNLNTLQYQPGTNSISIFVDGINQYGPGAQYSYVETDSDTITFNTGLQAGAKVKFTTAQLNTSGATDADQVNYTPPVTGGVSTTVQNKLAETISVQDFGAVGDGVTDDTAAIQAAIDYAIASPNIKYVEMNGFFAVTSVVVNGANNLTIQASGALLGSVSGTYDAVFVVKNSVDFAVVGRLAVSGSYNINYGAAIKIYQDGPGATSYLMFNNVYVGNAPVGWLIGDAGNIDRTLSEISITNGSCFGTPTAVWAIGTQTVVNFVNTVLQASHGNGTGAWLTLPNAIVRNDGGYVSVTSGEMLIVNITTGAVIYMTPVASPVYGNSYGSVLINGSLVESASQYLKIDNPSSLTPISAASAGRTVTFTQNSGFHSGATFYMVSVATDFPGALVFQNNNFYATVSRSIGNIDATGNTLCNIYCDAQSFGYNFAQGLSAIQGGIVHFDHRLILRSSNCNGQSLPSNTETILKWTANTNTEDTQRFNGGYSTSTGLFTVPAGGLKSVLVVASVRSNAPTANLDFGIKVNGSFVAAAPTTIGNATASGWQRATFDLGDLAAGDTIGVYATQIGTAGTTNGGQYETFSIYARN